MSEQTPSPEAPPKPPAGWRVKLKFLGIGLLAGALFGGVGAGKVYFDMNGLISDMSERLSAATSAQDLLRARAAVAATATELRRENFGDAKSNLTAARKHLDSTNIAIDGGDSSRVQAAQQRLNNISIDATTSNTDTLLALDEVGLEIDKMVAPK